jgi:signal recognition particle subunit SRP19
MRQQDKLILWPVYFDSTKTRKSGRRIAKNLAISNPKASEIKEAAEKLHFACELVSDVGYAKTPWLRPSMVLIKKRKESKEAVIEMIAKEMLKNRTTATTKQSHC